MRLAGERQERISGLNSKQGRRTRPLFVAEHGSSGAGGQKAECQSASGTQVVPFPKTGRHRPPLRVAIHSGETDEWPVQEMTPDPLECLALRVAARMSCEMHQTPCGPAEGAGVRNDT
jgi:hypothetical protein